jgi:BlaI family penicillinase repressor
MNSKSISKAEWEVLDVLWRKPGANTREVHAELVRSHGWSVKTVGTFLTRLLDKGAVTVQTEGRAFRYRAKISREKTVRREIESFLQRVFRGAAGPMLAHFCEETELTPEEIVRLEEILRRKKG